MTIALLFGCGHNKSSEIDPLSQYRDTIIGKFYNTHIDTLIIEPIDTTKERAFWDWIVYDSNRIDTLIVHNQFKADLISEGDLDGDGLDEIGCLHYVHGSGYWANYFVLSYKNGWMSLYNPINYHEWIGLTDIPFEKDSLVSKTKIYEVLNVRYYNWEKDTPQYINEMIDTLVRISPIPIKEIGWF